MIRKGKKKAYFFLLKKSAAPTSAGSPMDERQHVLLPEPPPL